MATTFTGPQPQKKQRAAIACTACHARKVRCNVVLVGQPCSNCQQDQEVCELHVSARGKHKRRRVIRASGDVASSSPSNAILTSPSKTSSSAPSDPTQPDLSTQDEYESLANVYTYRNIVE